MSLHMGLVFNINTCYLLSYSFLALLSVTL